jgi:hypothetical protein
MTLWRVFVCRHGVLLLENRSSSDAALSAVASSQALQSLETLESWSHPRAHQACAALHAALLLWTLMLLPDDTTLSTPSIKQLATTSKSSKSSKFSKANSAAAPAADSSFKSTTSTRSAASEQLAILCGAVAQLSSSPSDVSTLVRAVEDMAAVQAADADMESNVQYWQRLVESLTDGDQVLDENKEDESRKAEGASLSTLQHIQMMIDVFALMGHMPSQVCVQSLL